MTRLEFLNKELSDEERDIEQMLDYIDEECEFCVCYREGSTKICEDFKSCRDAQREYLLSEV